MIECKLLNKKDIYAIPIGDFFDFDIERLFILYAPLSGQSILVTAEELLKLEKVEEGKIVDQDCLNTITRMTQKVELPSFMMHDNPDSLHQLDILLNYTCNLKCVYCYSAQGRSQKEIDWISIKAMLDYLFDSNKKQTRPYVIHFSGGGEPLMSFQLIKQTVEYIESHANNHKYSLGIVSNGSLLTTEIAQYLKNHNIEVAISFEILEELQNKERGQYEKVATNIDMLQNIGTKFGIRTTFTSESVQRMSDMIKELHRRFPYIKTIVFDTVLSADLFHTPDELSAYYRNYIREFYNAKQYAKQLGIHLSSIAVETLQIIRDRTCEGKMVLTPMGTISACSRVSSPLEKLYDTNIYGSVKDGKIVLDSNKFRSIMDEHNIYTQKMCEHCYAKWNCGGGCRLFYQSFSNEYVMPKCRFTKESLRIELFYMLCEKFYISTNRDLKSFIKEKISHC